jgi:predicted glycosyltransferase
LQEIKPKLTPIIFSEIPLPGNLKEYCRLIPPTSFHKILSEAALIISDSCTITTEAAMLGVPTIFCHPDPSRLMNFKMLIEKYGLVEYAREINRILISATRIMQDKNARKEIEKKRNMLINDCEDVTQYIVDSIGRWCK